MDARPHRHGGDAKALRCRLVVVANVEAYERSNRRVSCGKWRKPCRTSRRLSAHSASPSGVPEGQLKIFLKLPIKLALR